MKVLTDFPADAFIGKYPRHTTDFDDLEACVEKFVLPGFIPASPTFSMQSKLRVQGSCFAQNLGKALQMKGMNVLIFSVTERGNTPRNNVLVLNHWCEADDQQYKTIADDDLFILTLGVAEGSTADNLKDIKDLIELIRAANPRIKIIITVSPVPLNRSLIPSTVVADCISKSKLRAAVAEYFEQPDKDVYYWPSFEIVRWLGAHLPPVFGEGDGLARHVNNSMIDLILRLFVKYHMTALR
jgi:hypothetical protein